MKQWRVDNYIIGPAVDAEYDHTADELAEVLNRYEKKGYKIQEVIEVREGFLELFILLKMIMKTKTFVLHIG